MKIILMRRPLVAAIAACVLGSVSLPALSADDAMMKRMEMLEQELNALKAQMQKQETAIAAAPSAKADVKVKGGGSLTFGGYLKADYRSVDGDLAYQDYWRGNNPGVADSDHQTQINIKESRLNAKYEKGDVTAYVEIDFYGGDGNEIVSNSTNPRLRHAFIKTGNWMVGQYWTTFTPLKAFPDALDFGGPIVGEVFVRQPQIRYSTGNWNFALENPETYGGTHAANGNGGGTNSTDGSESTVDFVATYNFKGDWGSVQVGALARKVDQGDEDETALAFNVGGRINVGEADDIRFQVNVGESGRYVGAGMYKDIVVDPDDGQTKVEETTAYTLAYRHVWNSDWRSTAYYGAAESDVLDQDHSHWGLNLIRQLRPGLSVGAEVGNFSIDDKNSTDEDSDYFQVSLKYDL